MLLSQDHGDQTPVFRTDGSVDSCHHGGVPCFACRGVPFPGTRRPSKCGPVDRSWKVRRRRTTRGAGSEATNREHPEPHRRSGVEHVGKRKCGAGRSCGGDPRRGEHAPVVRRTVQVARRVASEFPDPCTDSEERIQAATPCSGVIVSASSLV